MEWFNWVGSQATVERSIGEMGHKIESKKAPFANLANLIYEWELVKILSLYYPIVDQNVSAQDNLDNSDLGSSNFMQESLVHKRKQTPQDVLAELQALADWLKINLFADGVTVRRWGKFKLLNGYVLGSCSSM